MNKTLYSILPTRIQHAIRRFALTGDNVTCSICDSSFQSFLPFGVPPAPPRANALCPGCFSLERTRIYWRHIRSKSDFFSTAKKVLHFAPEPMLFKRFRSSKNVEYFPADRFEVGYEYPLGTMDMDITDIKFPDDHFDFVLCSHVLEHVPADQKAMSELFRVLKPGGWGILQVPMDLSLENTYEDHTITDPAERAKAFGQSDHVRIYGRDYGKRLEKAGFDVTIDQSATNMSPNDLFTYGFGAGEDLYIVSKPA